MLNTSCRPCCRIHLDTWMLAEEGTSFDAFVAASLALLLRRLPIQVTSSSLDSFVVLVLFRAMSTMWMITKILVDELVSVLSMLI